MPYIQLPDGNYFQVDEGTDYQSALTQAKRQFPTSFGATPAAPKATSGIMSALGSGFRGGIGEAAENVGQFTGIAGLQKFGQKQQEKAAASYAPTSDKDIEKASDQGIFSELGAHAKQFLEPYAQSAGNIAGRFGAPILAGATAGAGLALAAPELAATAVGGAGLEAMGLGTVGALAGTGATALADAPIEIGQKELERKRAGLPPDPLSSTAYGLAATAINTVSGHLLSGPIQGILGKTAAQEAKLLAPKVLAGDLTATEASAQLSGTLRNVLQGTAENAATGTAMMLGNTALSRASVGQDLTSPEARAQYGEDIKGALTLAPMFGLAHGLGARSAAEKGLAAEAAQGLQAREEAKAQQHAAAEAAGVEAPSPFGVGPQGELPGMETPGSEFGNTQANPTIEEPAAPVDYHRQVRLLQDQGVELQKAAAVAGEKGDAEEVARLAAQHAKLEEALQTATEQAGTQPKPLDAQIAEAQKGMADATQLGDLKTANVHAQTLLQLKQENPNMTLEQGIPGEKARAEQARVDAAREAAEANAEQAPNPFGAGPQGELPGMETAGTEHAAGEKAEKAVEAAPEAVAKDQPDTKQLELFAKPTAEELAAAEKQRGPIQTARSDIDRQIEAVQKSISEPQGGAKTSIYDNLQGLADKHATLTDTLGKTTDEAKRAALQKQVDATLKAYNNLVETKVEPARKQIERLVEQRTNVAKDQAELATRLAEQQKKSAQAKKPPEQRSKVPDRGGREAVKGGPTTEQLKGALQEVIDSAKFSEKTKAQARRHLEALSDPKFADKAEQGAFDFLTAQARAQRGLYRSPDADKPSSLKPGDVQKLSDLITKDWANAPKIQVHADETTLPQKIIEQAEKDGMTGKITGVYDPDTKMVHLVEQNLKTAQDVGLTIAHEAAGHFGLRETMGKRLDSTMDALYKGNEAVRKAADEKIAKGVDKRIAVEEVLAEMAEDGPASPAERSALRRIYDAIKGFLQDMAPRVFGNRVISDEAVRGIVANARKFVVEGGKAGEGKAETPIALYRNKVAPELKGAMDVANAVIATEKPLSERINKDAFGRGSLEFLTKMVDQFAPLVRVSRLMDAKAGTQMMYFLRMTGQRSNLLGQVVGRGALERVEKTRADGKKEWLYETKEGGPTLVGVNKALVDANKLTGSPEATAALFSLDNVAKRAKSVGLEKLNYEGLTQAKLNAAIKEIDAVPGLRTIFDKAHAEYQKFNEGNINFAVQTGYLSKDLAAKMRANKDYVPYYRENGNGEISLMMGNEEITKVGNVKSQPYLHELVGGNQRILDFNTAAVRNAGMLLDMGLRNEAAKAAAFGLKSVDMAMVRDGKASLGPNVFNFKIDGEDKHAIVQTANDIPAELLVKGMEGIPVQTSSLLHMMGLPSRLVRQMFVANPVSAGRILFKDTISSALVAGSDLTTLGESLKNVKDSMMERRGIAGGEVFQGLPADMANILREIQSGKPGWETLLAKAHVLHAKADAMTRQIRYDSYIKQGLSEMEASYMALESMNFTRRGISPSIHVLNTLNPFINSQIQGINTLVQSIRGTMPLNEKLKIRDKVLQRGMLLASSSMLYAALMQDDDSYKNSTPEQKYNNFFVPFPGVDEKVRVPIPFEAGMLFKSIPEALVNAMYGKDADAAAGMRQVVQKMIPGGDTLGIPQALRPAIEAGIGKSFYTGRDIESKHEQSMQPGTRTRDSTSAFADALGDELNVSPVKIDHLIQGYTGGLGLTMMQVASSLVFGKDRGPAPAESTLSQLPIIGSMFQPKDAGAVVDEAYSVMQEASQVKASYNDLITRGRPDAAAAYLAKNADEFNKAAMAQQFTSTMGQYQKELKAIMASAATPEEKRAAIDNLKERRTAYAEQTLKASEKTTPQ